MIEDNPIEVDTSIGELRSKLIITRGIYANGAGYVRVAREYEVDGTWSLDYECGISFDASKLDEVIAALTKMREAAQDGSGRLDR